MDVALPLLYALLLVAGGVYAWRRRHSRQESPRDQDAKQLQWFREHGRDLARPQPLEITISFAQEDLARRAGADLERRGYRIEVFKSEADDEWILEASQVQLVTLESAARTRSDGEDTARAHGGEFCGWGFTQTVKSSRPR